MSINVTLPEEQIMPLIRQKDPREIEGRALHRDYFCLSAH